MSDYNERRDADRRDGQHLSASSGRSGPSVALIALLVVAGLFVMFFLQNGGDVKVQFLTFEKISTVRWSIMVAVLFGIVLDRLFTIFWRRRQRQIQKLKNQRD